jgi:hypothetical protein
MNIAKNSFAALHAEHAKAAKFFGLGGFQTRRN